MTELVKLALAWLCIGFGVLTLTEGYHAFRQRAAREGSPARLWWMAGGIVAVGLGLILAGLELDRAAQGAASPDSCACSRSSMRRVSWSYL